MADTLWSGRTDDKLYLQSGQFSSTLKTSLDVSGIDNIVQGISWDGTNTPWSGNEADKLYLTSGQFSSTLKTSLSIKGTDNFGASEVSWDGTNTPWSGQGDKLYLQSGQFTSTIKDSLDISGIDTQLSGISSEGANTLWSGATTDKLYLQSGQFSSTVKTSLSITGIDTNPQGISFDGANTPWTGFTGNKLYLQSGQFSSTLKTSLDISGIDTHGTGIEHGDVGARLTPITPTHWAKILTANPANIATDDYCKLTAKDITGRSYAEVKTDLSLNNVNNVATDDTAYNATSWNANTDAATKNAIRDKVETMDTAIGSNTTHRGLTSGNPHSVTPTELSLIIGTDVQAWDAGLDSLAGLTYAAPAFVKMTGANAFALRTLQETSDDLEATIDHDNLLNFAANEHYLQSAITAVGTIASGTWQGTTIAINQGGTGQTTAQAAINALSAVSGATNEHVLTKDTGTGNAIWKAAGGGVAAHAILDGSVHTDSVADAVTRGSIIYGNATPKWDELVIGATDTFLGSDGTDISYRTAAQVMASLSGEAIAAFDLNGQDLTNGGVLFLTEQAAAEANVAGKGQFWIKTATPNEPWFDNDAGTETLLDNRLINRGDPATDDVDLTALNTDGNWYDLDLSGPTPANATWLLLYVSWQTDAANQRILLRKNGNTNAKALSAARTQVASVRIDYDVWVPCDSNQVIEYNITNGTGFVGANVLTVKGWKFDTPN